MRYSSEEAIQVLEHTPSTLDALLRGLAEKWLSSDEGEATWSPRTVIGHLIYGELTNWIPRARIVLEQGSERTFEPFDELAQFNESHGKTMDQLLDQFAELRSQNIAILKSWKLSDSALDFEATHPELGLVTLRQLLASWVVHDLGHIRQIARTMAKQYRDEIGPWRAYLPVVDD
jgi:hypothetical protein